MLVGKELGPYVIEKELGSGAMGAVYLARNKTTQERVAVKLMSPALGQSDSARGRFTREVAILKQLSHANIVRYKGSGRYHGSPFFIMEFIDGESLDHVFARRGRMTWEHVVELGIQLCAALAHAHERGIVHRDLKPSNLMMLKEDGSLKLTDFGIAKDVDMTALTAANSTVGTAAYMSPEQCRGARDIGAKSDLYSMGVMFYELLTGQKPFQAETAMEMFMKHANAPVPSPGGIALDCPKAFNDLVRQLMQKKTEDRPLDAEQVAVKLEEIKEAAAAQKSVGADVARMRRIDLSTTNVALDETDKEAARALLGKKKKKKKALPVYRQGWFTILALAGIGVLGLAFIWWAFFKAPGAESLFAGAMAAKNATDLAEKRIARKEYITPFLEYYPDHEKAPAVQKLADEFDLEDAEVTLHNRRNSKFAMSDDADKEARAALSEEDSGNLSASVQTWRKLASEYPYKTEKDPDKRGWGLLAEKSLKQIAAAQQTYRELLDEAKAEKKRTGTRPKFGHENKEAAMKAIWAELEPNPSRARVLWNDLKNANDDKLDQRTWYLVATMRKREMEESPKTP